MKNLRDIEETLKKSKPFLKKEFHVKEIGVFGSYARGEAGSKSDVDILVEFSKPIGWEFLDLKEYLEGILGITVDLVTVKGLKTQMRDRVLRDVVYA
jgi:hypothetical protein